MTQPAQRPDLVGLRLGDAPGRWAELGFQLSESVVRFAGVSIELGAPGGGICGWRLRGVDPVESIDGLRTEAGEGPAPGAPISHPNGAVGIDHVVVLTPRFDRTAAALAATGIELRRIRQAPGGFRQGFRRLGPVILELVEAVNEPDGPARFWGLVVNVEDLEALAERLGDQLGGIRAAVQPGRRIATLKQSAGLGEAVAFMSI